jgi:hypothetical protein
VETECESLGQEVCEEGRLVDFLLGQGEMVGDEGVEEGWPRNRGGLKVGEEGGCDAEIGLYLWGLG